MGLVVTGISQDGKIKQLEQALKVAGFPLESIDVVEPDDEVGGGGLVDSRLILGDRGMRVPGLGGGSGFHNETLSERLGDLEIPDSEIDNYVEAIEAGRTVVAYYAKHTEQTPQIEDIFRTAGLAKVKTF